MSALLENLAVIVPVGPNEKCWGTLLTDLVSLPSGAEVILVGVSDVPKELNLSRDFGPKVRWIKGEKGRGKQMNAGANATQKRYLWFLHADTRVREANIADLSSRVTDTDDALDYFNLGFLPDGPFLTLLNTWGTWFRTHLLQLPFGDQGFVIKRELFDKLGAFEENARYGEDHLFVWKVRHAGVALRCFESQLFTSARNYRDNGWGKTTIRHVLLTLRQAVPQYWKIIRQLRVP
ncbi:MAG: glycosyl transferase family 2 [Deltaproteobacteria bacterium]|nr:glycosyl transferase family 2 [Deltaproteobacteria bacterium]